MSSYRFWLSKDLNLQTKDSNLRYLGCTWQFCSPVNVLLTNHQIFYQLESFHQIIWLGNITRFWFFSFDFNTYFDVIDVSFSISMLFKQKWKFSRRLRLFYFGHIVLLFSYGHIIYNHLWLWPSGLYLYITLCFCNIV